MVRPLCPPELAATKNEVVVLIDGVVKGDPVPKTFPPELAAYQLRTEPADPVAPSCTVPVPQRLPGTGSETCGLFTTTALTGSEQITPAPFLMTTL